MAAVLKAMKRFTLVACALVFAFVAYASADLVSLLAAVGGTASFALATAGN